jgi:hypothetical protein
MQSQSPNPYFNMAMIRDVEMFFGRNNLLRRFYAALANRQSVSILGRRRIGKSSLLWCASLPEMQTRFSCDLSRHIFVFLDLHDYLDRGSEDFFHQVSRAIVEQGSRVAGLTLQAEGKGTEVFSGVLKQVIKSGFFPVLLLDSFDKVTQNEHFSPEFFGFLRAQASRGYVSYVTASMKPLYEVCHQGIEGSPFFNIFSTYRLGPLAPDEAYELISSPAQRAGVPFTEAEIALVRRLAGRHPFFIQRVCSFLFEEKTLSESGEVEEQLVADEAYRDLFPHFRDSWEQLTEKEQEQLRSEIRKEGYRQQEMAELSESCLFKNFLIATFASQEHEISAEELEAALDKLDDLKALGDTKLAQMQIMSQRFQLGISPMERGRVVREVLREALEQLKGDGQRGDSAPDWRVYNILYYRYFRYHLKNEQIASRISFSVRQYYRERDKAINSLRNVLLEMEQRAIQE